MTDKIKKPKFNAVSYSAGLRDGMDKAINKQTKSVIKLMELAREQGKKIRTEDILKLIDETCKGCKDKSIKIVGKDYYKNDCLIGEFNCWVYEFKQKIKELK